MPTLETYNGYPLWHYVPSLPAGIIFVIIFSILTAGHWWKIFRHRTWFCIAFGVGGIFEIIGYLGRALATNSTGTLAPYVMQSTFLLLAPILFAASLYATLGRIIRSVHGEASSMIKARWLTRIFVSGDVFSFIVQASGAGLLVKASMNDGSDNDTSPDLGSNIIIGGLIFQLVVYATYVLSAAWFHRKFKGSESAKMAEGIPWVSGLYMLYVTSAFIMARNIFRVVEYAMGRDGYLLSTEWPVYVFDAALMTVTMAWFFWRYPSQFPIQKGRELEMEMSRDRGAVRRTV